MKRKNIKKINEFIDEFDFAIVDSSSFNPRIGIKSRYSTTMKNWRRKSKIEKIYKIEKPTEEQAQPVAGWGKEEYLFRFSH